MIIIINYYECVCVYSVCVWGYVPTCIMHTCGGPRDSFVGLGLFFCKLYVFLCKAAYSVVSLCGKDFTCSVILATQTGLVLKVGVDQAGLDLDLPSSASSRVLDTMHPANETILKSNILKMIPWSWLRFQKHQALDGLCNECDPRGKPYREPGCFSIRLKGKELGSGCLDWSCTSLRRAK